jgi:hypothetical protein
MKKTAFRQPADAAGPTNLDSWVNLTPQSHRPNDWPA